MLVLAGAAFACALVFMGRFSSEWEHDQRLEVLRKYDVSVQGGAPARLLARVEVDSRSPRCVVITTGSDAPTME